LPIAWGIYPAQPMKKSIYFENDDMWQIRISDKPIVREVSQDWHTNISYAEDGTIVEIVLLDAKKEGLLPVEFRKAA
jgi:hypothetical protein